jgi:hypothetical protein
MTVEDVVIARLLALSTVTALVSTRVHLDKLPQTPTYPCIRVQNISDTTGAHLRGSDGIGKARIQVDAFAKELSGVNPKALADTVAAAVRGPGDGSALFGWQGGIGSPAFTVLSCLLEEKHESYDPEELRVVTVSQDFMVTYRA